MSIAGQLYIRVSADGDATIRSSRPLNLAGSFVGLTAAETLERVPLLFSLCGKAQLRAAQGALAAAGCSMTPDDAVSVRREAALEYLWRFAIDLPSWSGQPPAMAAFVELRRSWATAAVAEQGRALYRYLEERLLHQAPDDWSAQSLDEVSEWIVSSPAPAAMLIREAWAVSQPGETTAQVDPLPDHLTAGQLSGLAMQMAEADFCAQPQWQGRCVESGARSYQQAHPWFVTPTDFHSTVARLLARLLELVRLAECLSAPEESGADDAGQLALERGLGLGWVRTARGLLLHRIRWQDDKVTDYQILAPTEWNFHPQGALRRALDGCGQVPDQLRKRWLALQVITLDPCVGYELEVYDA